MRKTKIVCTLGPASSSQEVMEELIRAGMDVARMNFSHGSHQEQLERLETLKRAQAGTGTFVATLLDTKGPEIRLKTFSGGKAVLEKDSAFTLTVLDVEGDSGHASVTFSDLPSDVRPGDRILLDDGLIELSVVSCGDTEVACRVINGGAISDNKGVNLPGVRLSMPYLSERDIQDINFGIDHGFDFIAASFTRNAEDILQVREILNARNCHHIKIIAKIENAEGVENIDEILRVSDGIMVARGDMGVEIPFQDVPSLQKLLIKKAYMCGKVVITATQMLESMINHPRPTRAEATDVANAIYDGTSAIMLSGETAAGKYPVEAVKTMALLAERTELDIDYRKRFYRYESNHGADVTAAISHATCTTAYDLGAAAILTVTISGRTARMISRFRPDIPIIACTLSEPACRQLKMSWGVIPLMIEKQDSSENLFNNAIQAAKDAGHVKDGDLVAITAGVPVGYSGTTNLLRVYIVGDVLLRGRGINKKSVCANLCVASGEQDALISFKQGDILVINKTSNNILSLLKNASGIITEEDGMNTHAAIVGLALDIPVIVGALDATRILKSGTAVLLDSESGMVRNAGGIEA